MNSRTFHRWFPWIAGLVLVAGVVAALVLIVPNTGGNTKNNTAPPAESPPVQKVQQQKLLKKVPPEARRTAGKFILTAVVRKNLDQAWPLAGPDVRQGMSHEEWLNGNIAVAPFFGGIKSAPMSVDYATKDEALLEVLLIPQKQGKEFKSGVFYLKLNKVGQGKKTRWVVNEFTQRVGVPIPANVNNSARVAPVSEGGRSGLLASPRRRRRFTYLGGVIAVIGIVATLVVVLPEDNGDHLPKPHGGKPTLVAPAPKAVKLKRADAKAARAVGRQVRRDRRAPPQHRRLLGGDGPRAEGGLHARDLEARRDPGRAVPGRPTSTRFAGGWTTRSRITWGSRSRCCRAPTARRRRSSFELELVRAGPATNRRWLVDYWAPLGPGTDTPAARIKAQITGSSTTNTISGKWLAVPVVAVFGTLLAIPVALTVRGRLRHRRAEREYRARVGEPRF